MSARTFPSPDQARQARLPWPGASWWSENVQAMGSDGRQLSLTDAPAPEAPVPEAPSLDDRVRRIRGRFVDSALAPMAVVAAILT